MESHVLQVHISLAGEKLMRITWITNDNSAPSVVDYGTKEGTYTMTSQGESTSYSYLLLPMWRARSGIPI
jgi:hypothetical protein